MFSKVFVIGCLLASALGAPSLDDTRIVGGFNAQPGQFPYQVSLRYNSQHFCGGSIISTRTILTAAHCKAYPITGIEAVVGATYLRTGGVAHSIIQFYNHESYNPTTKINDIAVVIVSIPITYNQYTQPIPLPRYGIGDNVEAIATGWGLTSSPGNVPNNLQYLYTNTISFNKCKQMHNGWLYDSQICVLKQKGQGLCNGDSGGPLVSGGQLQGITSFGYPCAKGLPDFFTRVSSFVDWIKNHQVGL